MNTGCCMRLGFDLPGKYIYIYIYMSGMRSRVQVMRLMIACRGIVWPCKGVGIIVTVNYISLLSCEIQKKYTTESCVQYNGSFRSVVRVKLIVYSLSMCNRKPFTQNFNLFRPWLATFSKLSFFCLCVTVQHILLISYIILDFLQLHRILFIRMGIHVIYRIPDSL